MSGMANAKQRPTVVAEFESAPRATVMGEPIDVRSASLAILAALAIVFFVRWASPVLIPIVTAMVFSYALTPVVRWIEKRLRVPKVVGAALTIGSILLALGYGLAVLQPQALDVLDIVPRAVQKLTRALRGNPNDAASAVDKMKKAATELERAANEATKPSVPSPVLSPSAPVPADSNFKFNEYMLMGTASVITGAGQFFVVICLVYFLLVTGDAFRRTLVRVSGDTLTEKKITVQILDEIDTQIQRYLLVQLGTSVLLGVATWAIFASMGLKDAVIWGCVGGLLHLVPYVGPTAFVAVTTLVAYVELASVRQVVIVVASVLCSIGLIGVLLVPWLTQKIGKIKAVVVFVALLVWGWLWGVWGLLLGIPIVMAINAVCERVDELHLISEFLSYQPPAPEPVNAGPAATAP
jgi:predicted PurR-regulated permease PerM